MKEGAWRGCINDDDDDDDDDDDGDDNGAIQYDVRKKKTWHTTTQNEIHLKKIDKLCKSVLKKREREKSVNSSMFIQIFLHVLGKGKKKWEWERKEK